MKKIFYTLSLSAALMLGTAVNHVHAAEAITESATKETTMSEAEKEAAIAKMKLRVEEIKAMDKSTLSKSERKALRKELRDMNKEARALGAGGVYLSVAAIVIIILVLILIL